MLRRVVLVASSIFAFAAPSPAHAQDLRGQIRQLFTFGTCGEFVCLSNLTGFHGAHFKLSADTDGIAMIAFLGSSIGLSVSNTPISSSSSGTTFKFVGGVPVKTSTSAGPIFAERSQTLGRGRWFVGLGLTQMNFQRLRGVPLNALSFNYTHQDVGDSATGAGIDTLGSPAFENDFINVKMAIDINLLVASLALTYGLVDGVDVGVTVPFVRTSIHGNSVAQIVPAGGAIVHYFAGSATDPVLTAVSSADGVASGIGDLEGHLKINVAQTDNVGGALFVSARFPTGDEKNLLGSGAFSGRALGVVSARFGSFSPHLNLGYTVRDASDQNNSIDGALGYDALLSPWATMAVDMLGSWEIGASRLHVPPPVQYLAPAKRTLDVTNIPSQPDNLMSLNFGFKFRTRRGIQIVTNSLFPLRNSGLQPSVAWTAGLEYNF
jgi:hypothetical protein